MDRCGVFLSLCCCLLLLSGCELDDDRDACCNRAMMTYKLTYNGVDYFPEEIRTMTCYLFTADSSRYLGKLYPDPERPNQVSLQGLEEGDYEMIGFANLSDYGDMEELEEGIDSCCFHADDCFRQTKALANGDSLFWGAQRFSLVRNGENRFETEMSNIHCHLTVHIEWEGLPPEPDGYYMQLEGVWDGYCLCPEECREMGGKLYPPYEGGLRSVVQAVPLRQLALETTFTTLRYSNRYIPSLRLWNRETPLTKLIDLQSVFWQWGWLPDKAAIQEYAIYILIHRDGTIEIRPYMNAGINDWVDGGSFG